MKTVPQAAQALGISKSLVWKLIYAGKVPFVRINSSVLLRDEDLQEFIQANLQRHTPKLRDVSSRT